MEPVANVTSPSGVQTNLLDFLGKFQRSSFELERTLRTPSNQTFVSNREKDRIIPPTPEEATKVIEPGDREKSLASSFQLSGVSQGFFTINNVGIAVNPTSDTFQDIVSRISGSAAGVTATFDREQNELVITSDNPSRRIEIQKDTSGFLGEVNVALGSFNGSTRIPNFNNPGNPVSGGDITENILGVVGTFQEVERSSQISNEARQIVSNIAQNFAATSFQSDFLTTGFNVGVNGKVTFDEVKAIEGLQAGGESAFLRFFDNDAGLEPQVSAALSQVLAPAETESRVNIFA